MDFVHSENSQYTLNAQVTKLFGCCCKSLIKFSLIKVSDRYPEAGDELEENPYCSISMAHTMCKFTGPDPNCDLLHRGFSTDQKTILTDKLNE